MELSKEQQSFYESARSQCRKEVEQMNNTIRSEWAHLNSEIKRVQELIQTLETRKQSVGQMYASASEMLSKENDLDISQAINSDGSSDDLGMGEIDL